MSQRQRGFTLVELLVAMFIAAIMFGIGYRTINRGLIDREAVKSKEDRIIAIQKSLRTFEQDFSQVAPRPIRDPTNAGYKGAFLALENGTELVQFTRSGWANPAGVQRPALERVSYALENGVLKRRHFLVLDPVLAAAPVSQDLLDHVKTLSFRYMAGAAHQWQPLWPQAPGDPAADAARSRPIAVEITLELEDYGKILRIIEIPG